MTRSATVIAVLVRTIASLAKIARLNALPLDEFLAVQRRFLVYGDGWLTSYLIERGLPLEVVGVNPRILRVRGDQRSTSADR